MHIENLPLAWECVIKSHFKDVNKTRSFDQESTLSRALVLIQTCPVSSKLNLIEIANDCLLIGRPHMAAIIIGFANENDRAKIISLLQNYKSKSLKQEIIDLEEMGIIPMITKFVIRELEL